MNYLRLGVVATYLIAGVALYAPYEWGNFKLPTPPDQPYPFVLRIQPHSHHAWLWENPTEQVGVEMYITSTRRLAKQQFVFECLLALIAAGLFELVLSYGIPARSRTFTVWKVASVGAIILSLVVLLGWAKSHEDRLKSGMQQEVAPSSSSPN